MSMISPQIDELRATAEEIDWEFPFVASRLRGAADTITELQAENAKLRELLSSYWKAVHCPATPNVPRDYLAEMRELGVEVNE